MVEGYRTEEDFARERARAEADVEARNKAALEAAIAGALLRLEGSGRKPDCVVEIKKRPLFGGASRRSKLARVEAWFVGVVDLGSDSQGSHAIPFALGTDRRLYTGYWYPERRALRTSFMNVVSDPVSTTNGHGEPLGGEGLVQLLDGVT
jgi:hypothetical protein